MSENTTQTAETNKTNGVTIAPVEVERNEKKFLFVEHEKTRPVEEKGKKYLAPKITKDNLLEFINWLGLEESAKIVAGRIKQWAQSVNEASVDQEGNFVLNTFLRAASTFSVRGGEKMSDLKAELAELQSELLKVNLLAAQDPTHPEHEASKAKVFEIGKDMQDIQAQIELKSRSGKKDEDEEETSASATTSAAS